jgi:hypothetical protein
LCRGNQNIEGSLRNARGRGRREAGIRRARVDWRWKMKGARIVDGGSFKGLRSLRGRKDRDVLGIMTELRDKELWIGA